MLYILTQQTKMIIFDDEKKVINKVTIDEDGKQSYPRMLANCTMILQSMGFDSDGEFAYFVKLEGSNSFEFKVFTAKDSSKKAFSDILFSLGFLSKASDSDVIDIFLTLGQQKTDTKSMLYLKNFSGRYHKKGYDFVVCKNGIFDIKDSKFSEYGEKKNVTLSDGTVILVEFSADNASLFPVWQDPEGEYIDMTVLDFYAKKVSKLWKNSPYAMFAFSWFIGTLFVDEVVKYGQESFFPLLFITGNAGHGKTQILRIMRRMVGYNSEPVGFESASAFINELEMSYVHSFPIWRDEYRADCTNIDKKHAATRDFYNRSNTAKGRADLTSKSFPVNATMMISGEGRPKDKAVNRRLIPFAFESGYKHEATDYHFFLNDSMEWAQILPAIYKRGKEIDWKQFLIKYKIYLKEFVSYVHPEKMAVLAAIFDLFINADDKAMDVIKKQSLKYIEYMKGEFPVADQTEDFFEAVHLYFLKKSMYSQKYDAQFVPASAYARKTETHIYIYMAGMLPFYNEQMTAANTKDFKGSTELRSIFKDVFGAEPTSYRFNGSSSSLSCLSFPIKTAPETLKVIVDTIEDEETRIRDFKKAQVNSFE